jgi:oligopeptide transport system ATP-binding protein
MAALLDIRDLSIRFDTPAGPVLAVDGASFAIGSGECVGVVGESGAGKTQLFLSVLRLLAASARTSGTVTFEGVELLGAPLAQVNRIRGRRVGMIFQDPMTSLTPHLTVGRQLSEVLGFHLDLDGDTARRRALELLDRVHVNAPAERLGQYPHQLSGGLRQRVMIAVALACQPQLLIADEPTSALDVTVQAGVLDLLRELRQEQRLGIVLITHDLAVAAGLCDRIAVMRAGRIVEEAPATQFFQAPRHPYSAALLACVPRIVAAYESAPA